MRLWWGLLVVWGLYFFALFMAQESPLFTRLSYPTHQLFGAKWSVVFFTLACILGFLILTNKKIYSKRLFKFAFLFLLVLCSILNFQLLNYGIWGSITETIRVSVETNGWRLWYLWLRGASYLFGEQANAIKGFFVLAMVGVVIAITLYYKIKLPSVSLDIPKDIPKAKAKKAAAKKTTKKKATAEEARLIEQDMDQYVANEVETQQQAELEKQTLKNMLRDKISKKIQVKEEEEQIKEMHMDFPQDKPTFPIHLLDIDKHKEATIDDDWLLEKAQSIKAKLQEFGINVEIEGFNIGPTVMQIKIKPPAGTKVSKIENLKKDIALGVKSKSLRILAPIPGSSNVGIEIPNPKPQMVRLREVLGGLEFTKSMSEGFTNLAVGKGIDGRHVVKSLSSMPHLLIAGATGSGKSVGVNDFIISLIYQNSPSELKFIMVDPKQVELSIYEGIPYLLSPIITESDKAVKVLRWAVNHMNERYQKLKEQNARNIDEYNAKVEDNQKLYRLVIIIDELADLMMSSKKKDTESYITRIAQMARAVGMHLVLATQRPSVNVITGLIKANIPTRVAFGVVSQVDSRTILDMKGAEDLVGKGDLLYIDPKHKYPIRIQSPFVSTAETESIVKAIKEKYMTNLTENDIYHPEIMRILESKGEMAGGGNISSEDEDLIEQAIEIISSTRKASATMLQRKLGIGFPRAARLIDALEARGIVWPQEWAKPREILI